MRSEKILSVRTSWSVYKKEPLGCCQDFRRNYIDIMLSPTNYCRCFVLFILLSAPFVHGTSDELSQSRELRIIGGEAANEGEYPYYGRLYKIVGVKTILRLLSACLIDLYLFLLLESLVHSGE